jgi:hypothetical protein
MYFVFLELIVFSLPIQITQLAIAKYELNLCLQVKLNVTHFPAIVGNVVCFLKSLR